MFAISWTGMYIVMIIPNTRQPIEPALCSWCLVMWRSRWSLINWERGPRERKLCISPSSSMSSPPSDCTINRLYSLKLPPQDHYPSSKFLSNLEARQRSQEERIIRGRRRRRNEGEGSLQHTYITSIFKITTYVTISLLPQSTSALAGGGSIESVGLELHHFGN